MVELLIYTADGVNGCVVKGMLRVILAQVRLDSVHE